MSLTRATVSLDRMHRPEEIHDVERWRPVGEGEEGELEKAADESRREKEIIRR